MRVCLVNSLAWGWSWAHPTQVDCGLRIYLSLVNKRALSESSWNEKDVPEGVPAGNGILDLGGCGGNSEHKERAATEAVATEAWGPGAGSCGERRPCSWATAAHGGRPACCGPGGREPGVDASLVWPACFCFQVSAEASRWPDPTGSSRTGDAREQRGPRARPDAWVSLGSPVEAEAQGAGDVVLGLQLGPTAELLWPRWSDVRVVELAYGIQEEGGEKQAWPAGRQSPRGRLRYPAPEGSIQLQAAVCCSQVWGETGWSASVSKWDHLACQHVVSPCCRVLEADAVLGMGRPRM